MTAARITVLPHFRVRGWDGRNDGDVEAYPVVELLDALSAAYPTDAHFVPYFVQESSGAVPARIPRINLPGLAAVRAAGAEVLFASVWFDVDYHPAHEDAVQAAPDGWRAAELAKVRQLPGELADVGSYDTRRGYRLFYLLPDPVAPEVYVRIWRALAARLTACGLVVDRLEDWTRLYRLPRVVRDGATEDRPIRLEGLDALERDVVAELLGGLADVQAADDASRPFQGIERTRTAFVLPDVIEEDRNVTLTRFAGVMRRGGAGELEVLAGLRGLVEQGRCGDWQPEVGELEHIARSIMRYEPGSAVPITRAEPGKPIEIAEPPVLESDARFRRGSEVEFAAHVVADLGGEDVLAYDRSRLWRYESGLWREVGEEVSHNTLAGWDGEWIYQGKNKQTLEPKFGQLKVSARLQEGVWRVLTRGVSRIGFFDDAAPGLTFRNGFLRVVGGRPVLEAVNADQRSTVGLPWDWRPGLVPGAFLAALRGMFRDEPDGEGLIGVLREFIGACLLGQATRYQKGLILMGDGANGKSTVLDVVTALFADDMVTAIPPQEFAEEYRRAMLARARINVVNELPEAEILGTEAVKAILAGDMITARFIREQPFSFRPALGILLAANELPGVRDMSRGFWRRWIVLPFRREFADEEQDRDLAARIIRDELEAVAVWAIEGAAQLDARGCYAVPGAAADALEDWRRTADNVARFLEDATDPVDLATHAGTAGSELFARYQRWAQNELARPVGSKTFFQRLRRLGVKTVKRSTSFYGVEVRNGLRIVPGGSVEGLDKNNPPLGKSA